MKRLQYKVLDGETEREAYERALVNHVTGYAYGCPDGKNAFLNSLGIIVPEEGTVATFRLELTTPPGCTFNEYGDLVMPLAGTMKEEWRGYSTDSSVSVRTAVHLLLNKAAAAYGINMRVREVRSL